MKNPQGRRSRRTKKYRAAATGRFIISSDENHGTSTNPARSESQAAAQPASSLPVQRRAAARKSMAVPNTQRMASARTGHARQPARQRVGEISERRLDLDQVAIGQESLPDARGVGEVVGLVDVERAEDEARQAQETDRCQQDPRRGEKLLHRRRRLVPRLIHGRNTTTGVIRRRPVTAPPERRGVIAAVTRAGAERPLGVLLVALAVVAVSAKLASGLEIRSSFEELLPSDMPSVRQVKELIRRVGGDGNVLVVVESMQGPDGLKKAEAMAMALTRDFLAMGPDQIRSVQSSMAPIRDWYLNHWPLFVPLEDLRKARDAVREEVRKRKVAANPLAVSLDDEEPAPAQDKPEWLDPNKPLPRGGVGARFEN